MLFSNFILFISIKSILSSVIIPFKNNIQDNLIRNIFENLYITKITSNLKLGTPLQEIELYIQLQEDHIIVINSESEICKKKKLKNVLILNHQILFIQKIKKNIKLIYLK